MVDNEEIAVLMCIYVKDNINWVNESIDSIVTAKIPDNTKLNLYLHLDGEVELSRLDALERFTGDKKIIKSSLPVGLANGLNKLISALQNEKFIFRMDADDICCSDRFEKQIAYMKNNPFVDVLGGSISEFEGHPNNETFRCEYPSVCSKLSVLKASPIAHVSVCFRADFFQKFGVYPANFPLNEDIALWGNALSLGAVIHNLGDVLVKVRMDGAYARRSSTKAFYEFKAYRENGRKLKTFSIYPYIRFVFRFFPQGIIALLYKSKFRNQLKKHKKFR